MRRASGGRHGTLTVELALILPALLALIFGVLEMGHLFEKVALLGHAGDEAIRQAIVGGTVTEVENTAITATCGVDAADLDVQLHYRSWQAGAWGSWQTLETTEDGNSAPTGSQVRVVVRHQHAFLFSRFFGWLGKRETVGTLELVVSRHLYRE